MPKLLTKIEMTKLVYNGRKSIDDPDHDPIPVVKWFNPVGSAIWLISEIDPYNLDTAFGLCDLGMGSPELGKVSIQEIKIADLHFGLRIERDRYFSPDKTIGQYADQARIDGKIRA